MKEEGGGARPPRDDRVDTERQALLAHATELTNGGTRGLSPKCQQVLPFPSCQQAGTD